MTAKNFWELPILQECLNHQHVLFVDHLAVEFPELPEHGLVFLIREVCPGSREKALSSFSICLG